MESWSTTLSELRNGERLFVAPALTFCNNGFEFVPARRAARFYCIPHQFSNIVDAKGQKCQGQD